MVDTRPPGINITTRLDGSFRVSVYPRPANNSLAEPQDFPTWLAADAHARAIQQRTDWPLKDHTGWSERYA